MVKDDGVEISTVVVPDEILGGVGNLEASCPQGLLLQQRLVQGEDHLEAQSQDQLLINSYLPR